MVGSVDRSKGQHGYGQVQSDLFMHFSENSFFCSFRAFASAAGQIPHIGKGKSGCVVTQQRDDVIPAQKRDFGAVEIVRFSCR